MSRPRVDLRPPAREVMTEVLVGYRWSYTWAEPADASLAMAHTGVVITREGLVVTGAASEPALLVRERGRSAAARRIGVAELVELHGLVLVEEAGEELIWIADPGAKLYGGGTELDIRSPRVRGTVIAVDLTGAKRRELDVPPLAAYEAGPYRPTGVAIDEVRHGGGGDIWIADGYGGNLVHRYDANGDYSESLSGEEGAGRFAEPHSILIDRRRSEPELYVADRRNGRIQVYGLDSRFRRVVGEGVLPGPTQMAACGDMLLVTDLLAGRVTVLDARDEFVAHLFADECPPASWEELPDAWPNARSDDGSIVAAILEPERFHSPHGIAVDGDRSIYVSEFAIGGRLTVLEPA